MLCTNYHFVDVSLDLAINIQLPIEIYLITAIIICMICINLSSNAHVKKNCYFLLKTLDNYIVYVAYTGTDL